MELNFEQIKEILPHRSPFLLIDRVTDLVPGESAEAVKCVSGNEPFFQGHFPGKGRDAGGADPGSAGADRCGGNFVPSGKRRETGPFCNFSSLHFDRADFPRQLADIAARYEVPHALLEVEITESSIMSNPESACAQIMQLKERGFLIAIDDFGSGYSSLGQIQQIMADVLKLDRSFVQRNILGAREQIVLSNVIRMATELGMSVICEGVETGEQADILIQLGCRNAQGIFLRQTHAQAGF